MDIAIAAFIALCAGFVLGVLFGSSAKKEIASVKAHVSLEIANVRMDILKLKGDAKAAAEKAVAKL